MAQDNIGQMQGLAFTQDLAQSLKAMNDALAAMSRRLNAIEGEVGLSTVASSDDTVSESSDAGTELASASRASRRQFYGGRAAPLICVTAIEGDRKFNLVMARKDISGVHAEHLKPPTVSSTERYENVMRKLVRELWAKEPRTIREEFNGPYYKVQRRDLVPPYRPRNKRYHMQCSFNGNSPWPHTQSGFFDIDPRAWDLVLHVATAIRVICKDVTTTHGELWLSQ